MLFAQELVNPFVFEFAGFAFVFDKTALWLMIGNLLQLTIIIWLLFRGRSGDQPPQP